MTEKKKEAAFIPCGDAMEKMQQLSKDALENVSCGMEVCKQAEQAKLTGLQPGAKMSE